MKEVLVKLRLLFLLTLSSIFVDASAVGNKISQISHPCAFSSEILLRMDPADARDILLYLHHDICVEYQHLPVTNDVVGIHEMNPEISGNHFTSQPAGDIFSNSKEYDESLHDWVSESTQSQKEYDYLGLASFEFHTSEGEKSKDDRQTSTRNNVVDQRSELLAFYNATHGDKWQRRTGWGTQRPICEWYGILCDKCRRPVIEQNRCPVLSIQLNENNLKGVLLDISLPYLQVLFASTNELAGTIPNFQNMTNLIMLALDDNQFNGDVPDLQYLINLQYFSAFNNQLNGTVPHFDNLSNLLGIDLGSNYLTGPVPQFRNLVNLLGLDFGSNRLSGTLLDFTGLASLQELWLDDNQLNGSIPHFEHLNHVLGIDLGSNLLSGLIPDFNGLSNLEEVFLYNNNLNGTVPNFSGLESLKELYLYGNQINGTIPNFENLATLVGIDLGSNQLDGTIPEFSNLANMQKLVFNRNFLTGVIPNFRSLTKLKVIDLSNNGLIGQIPDFSGCPNLMEILLSDNILNGTIPVIKSAGLRSFDIRSNGISGSIPDEFEGKEIELLDFSDNQLSGTVPRSFEKMSQLKFVHLNNNSLEGLMPPKFWNLFNLFLIDLSHNRFSGDVRYFIAPASTSLIYKYKYLNLEGNQLYGPLDARIYISLHQIYELNLKNNYLTGLEELPAGRLWKRLDLSDNPITTAIPESYRQFLQMEYLGLRNTLAHHHGNSLVPTFTEPVDPYNLRDRFDLFICPTIRATNSSTQTELDIDSEYYGIKLCQCLPNYFGFAGRCVLCPNECECEDGLSLRRCHASPNIADIRTVVECPQPRSCIMQIPPVDRQSTKPAVVEQLCEVGYTGRACSRCEVGYGRQGRGCVLCKGSVAATSIATSVISIVLYVVYTYRSSSNGSGKFRIMIFHVQTLSILSSVWTTSQTMQGAIEWSYTLGSLQMPNLGCVLESTNLADSVMYSFLRIPMVLFMSILLFILSPIRRDKVIFVALNVLLLFTYNIARDVFGVFGCTVYDEGDDVWYLNVAPWIVCNPISAEMERMLKMAVPVFFLHILGFPVGLLHFLKNRKADDPSNSQRIGFLYLAYKEECWFWELIVMSRRLLFSFATTVLPYSHQGIVLFVLLTVIQASIWLQHKKTTIQKRFGQQTGNLELACHFCVVRHCSSRKYGWVRCVDGGCDYGRQCRNSNLLYGLWYDFAMVPSTDCLTTNTF
eukprot:TRINITY_DN2351_c0_g1_i15.p1 TRINITY_DN2351_c0_g1~~TRINITY_DN2351_c0_g1_i15.p1  ORF type:complete len:1204 (+),score=139.09 TRINITY_DN2351_c0_g1_i15:70-3681(+)